MQAPRQHHVALILARELAANVATPMLVVDTSGTVQFVNEAAARALGVDEQAARETSPDEWRASFAPRDDAGSPVAVDDLPHALALRRRAAVHAMLTVNGPGGEDRRFAVTSVPLMGNADEPAGAVVIFWEASP